MEHDRRAGRVAERDRGARAVAVDDEPADDLQCRVLEQHRACGRFLRFLVLTWTERDEVLVRAGAEGEVVAGTS